jgi:hypothetical protein
MPAEEGDRPAELRQPHRPVDVGQRPEIGIGMPADLEDRRPAPMAPHRFGHHHRIAPPPGYDADGLTAEIEAVDGSG